MEEKVDASFGKKEVNEKKGKSKRLPLLGQSKTDMLVLYFSHKPREARVKQKGCEARKEVKRCKMMQYQSGYHFMTPEDTK